VAVWYITVCGSWRMGIFEDSMAFRDRLLAVQKEALFVNIMEGEDRIV
jgi:hypothetical protein